MSQITTTLSWNLPLEGSIVNILPVDGVDSNLRTIVFKLSDGHPYMECLPKYALANHDDEAFSALSLMQFKHGTFANGIKVDNLLWSRWNLKDNLNIPVHDLLDLMPSCCLQVRMCEGTCSGGARPFRLTRVGWEFLPMVLPLFSFHWVTGCSN